MYIVAGLHLGLLIDRLPFFRILYSGACLLMCTAILPEFPAVEYSSPTFIATMAMSMANHFQWFWYFVDHPRRNSITQMIAFFSLIVWAVPLGILVSLVSPSSYLPTTDPRAPKRQSLIKAFLSHFDLISNFTESTRTNPTHY
jgi:hypothetical protein